MSELIKNTEEKLLSLDQIFDQEKEFSFDSFTNHDALVVAKEIYHLYLQSVEGQEHIKGIGIRIVKGENIILQYLMDGKKNDEWLIRKINTVYKFSHCSLYTRVVTNETHEFDELKTDVNYAICGGGFPVFVQGKLEGAIAVSGLLHYQDHDLIVQAINECRKKGLLS